MSIWAALWMLVTVTFTIVKSRMHSIRVREFPVPFAEEGKSGSIIFLGTLFRPHDADGTHFTFVELPYITPSA
jgi:hypothetical protein